MYRHITLEERFRLATLLKEGFDHEDIADRLGKSRSSITREIQRNSKLNSDYDVYHAHRQAKLRRRNSKINSRKIENNINLAQRIETKLQPLVSPEVIAHDELVCHESIYSWIYRSRPDLKSKLPQRGQKRRRYGSKRGQKQGWTRDVRSIEKRPLSASNRTRLGHWEGDTVKLQGGALLTHTERKSRFEIVHLIFNEGADITHTTVKQDKYLKQAKSITYDRGSSFALWRMIERDTKAKVFFANAHHPWERGTNENHNQRLRRMFPKGTRYASITSKDIRNTVWTMNHTKRKCLNWRTPCEVFGSCCTST